MNLDRHTAYQLRRLGLSAQYVTSESYTNIPLGIIPMETIGSSERLLGKWKAGNYDIIQCMTVSVIADELVKGSARTR